MSIEKLHLICPNCLLATTDAMSEVNEKTRCSKCGVVSNSADYILSTVSKDYSVDQNFNCASIRVNGENWSLKIKPRHLKSIMSTSLWGIIPAAIGMYIILTETLLGLIPLLFGMLFGWELLVRLLGTIKLTLVGNRLTHFKGIGPIGIRGELQWSKVSEVKYHQDDSRLNFYTSAGDPSNKGSIRVYFDLSSEQSTYIENFLYEKIDQRDKKLLYENS